PRAMRALTRWTGVQPAAVMPLEAAGLNGTMAAATAAQLGLPLVDADLMGRALPRMDQLTRAVAGGAVTPFALSEPSGQTLLIDAGSPGGLERIARSFVAQSGGWAGMALVPAPASAALRDACLGGLGRALRLGQAHRELPDKPEPEQVAAALGGRLLGLGRVADISRQPSTSFGRASITVLGGGSGAGAGPVLRLEAENEYLLALRDGEPVASCPDLICVLERRTATPIAVDSLRPGDDLIVVVLPGPAWWRASPERLRHVDPRAFGLGCDAVLLPEPVHPGPDLPAAEPGGLATEPAMPAAEPAMPATEPGMPVAELGELAAGPGVPG
ncbi:MAG TPA: DUF917 domain-containing protein, partial [Pseudonocardia sp.]|nr:DUF917 domain-containing protein [Pseudonocardia sp.]